MRHKLKLKRLSKPTDQRLAMLRSGVTSFIKYGKMKTSQARAKEIRRMAEKLITIAKEGSVHARRKAYKLIPDRDIIKKLFEIGKNYAERNGGYTRLTKVGVRKGDAATICLIEFVS